MLNSWNEWRYNERSIQPVPARVEEPLAKLINLVEAWCHEQSTLSQDALSLHGKVGCQNLHTMPVRIPPQAENTNQQTIKAGGIVEQKETIFQLL